MTRKEITKILEEYSLSPNKKLGQNFLSDGNIADRIIETSRVSPSDRVLEIGPGLGELTGKLLETGCFLTSVEIDSGMHRFLADEYSSYGNFTLVHADYLKTGIPGPFSKVISNLPYCCSSEILFKCAGEYFPDLICVMLQKEMAERIISRPGTASYGAMTVMLGIRYSSTIAFSVKPSSFYPAPEVTSSVLLMKRSGDIKLSDSEFSVFSSIVKSSFWGRRKTFVKACSSSPHAGFDRTIILDALGCIGINDSVRGESLSIEQFARLARIIAGHEDVFNASPRN